MQCEHAGCSCAENGVERNGRRYCSEECASRGPQRSAGGCGCGHPDCS